LQIAGPAHIDYLYRAQAGQTLGNLRRQIVAKLARPLRVLPAPID